MYRSNNRETGYRPGEVSREKPKNNSEKLKGLLREIANSLNREAEESYGISGLLDDECQVLMTGYQEIYSQAFLEQSARDVREREIAFSGATNPNVQHNYRVQYQIEGQDNIIAKWKENKKKEKNSQMEMVVTALLHKVLGDRYFIVRTSEFDDYHNGIDNIIIDKQTGAVVCAFDEVHEGGVGDRTQKKQEKISKTAKKGGARLRFGLQMERGRLKRSKQEGLPVFYLGLNTEELVALTENMNYQLDQGLSEEEKIIFQKLIGSVKEQFDLLSSESLPGRVRQNLLKFSSSLKKLEQYSASLS